jgi:hypothetical protein
MFVRKHQNTIYGVISVLSTGIVVLQLVTIIRLGTEVVTTAFAVLGVISALASLIITPLWYIGGRRPSA